MNKFLFDYGDAVRINISAPQKFRPAELGSICGIRVIDTAYKGEVVGEQIGTVMYIVEYPDGSSLEIPERYLEKLDNP